MLPLILTELVNVLRRQNTQSASKDQFNNPSYGAPTTWASAYTGINVRVSLSGKKIKWAGTGELIYPEGIFYIPTQYTIKPQDRIVIVTSQQGLTTGVEYIVE